MPGWFIVFGLVALCGIVAAQSGNFVLISVLYTLGLMLPASFVLANLWLVWLVLLPIVLLSQIGRPLQGLMAAGALAAAGMFALQSTIAQAVAAFAPQPMISLSGVLEARPAQSADVVTNLQEFLYTGACGVPCEQLLTGGLEWLRIIDQSDDQETRTSVFRRAPEAECLALDADFPPGAPCILAASDTGLTAELWIELRKEYAPNSGQHQGITTLMSTTRLQVTDTRNGMRLHDDAAIVWRQVSIPIMITVDMSMEPNGGEGAVFARREMASGPPPDLLATLAALGQPVAPPRPMVATPSPQSWEPAQHLADAPQDTVLILSLLAMEPSELSPGAIRQLGRWLDGVRWGLPATDAVRQALVLVTRRASYLLVLLRLITDRPELFIDDPAD